MSASTYAARRAAERAQHFQSLQAIADLVQGDRRQGIPPDLSLQDTIVFHVGDDSDGDPAAVDFVTDGTPVRLPRRSGPSGNQVTWKHPAVETTPPTRFPLVVPAGPVPVGDATLNGRGRTADPSDLHAVVADLARIVTTVSDEIRHSRPVPVAVPPQAAVIADFQPPVQAAPVAPATFWYAVGKGVPNLEYTVYETASEARIAMGEVVGSGYECFTDKGRALAFVARCRTLAGTLA
jgi:hypothetical protein